MKSNLQKRLMFLSMILLGTGFLFAQNKVGTTAAPFLGIPVGPRAQAMGSAYVAAVNDVTAAYWNPGVLPTLASGEFHLAHSNWLLGTGFNWVGLNINLSNNLSMGFSITQLDYGREEITTLQEQEGTGRYWDAQDLSASLSLATALTNRFSIGMSLKYINQRIWNESASSVALDIGFLFVTNFKGMRLGLNISNYGPDMRLDGDDLLHRIDIDPSHNGNNETLVAKLKTESYPLPLFFRIGLAFDVLKAADHRFTIATDALHPTDNVESLNVGGEYSWKEMIFLRAGYKNLFMPDSQEGLTLGGGIQYKIAGLGQIKIDYAYLDFRDFNPVQTFGVSYVF